MASLDQFISNLLKKPAFTLAITALTGFGIGYLYEKNRTQTDSKPLSVPAPGPKREKENKPPNIIKYDELPSELESNIEELIAVINEYIKLVNEAKGFETILPQALENEQDLLNICSNLPYTEGKNDLKGLNRSLCNPIWDILNRGGVKWRTMLNILLARAYDKNIEEVIEIAKIVDFINGGLMIIEDIENESETRDNEDAIHVRYGLDISLNVGGFAYFLPWLRFIQKYEKKLSEDKFTRILNVYIQEMMNIHFGYAWDLQWHNNNKLAKHPSETQYLQMIAHRVGSLTRLGTRLTFEILNLSPEMQRRIGSFSVKIAMALCIYKENAALKPGQDKYNHGQANYGGDISQDKTTLAIVHSLSNGSFENSKRLMDILKMRTKEKQYIDEAVNLLNRSGSIEYAKNKADQLIKNAWEDIKVYIPNNKYKGYIKMLVEAAVSNREELKCLEGFC